MAFSITYSEEAIVILQRLDRQISERISAKLKDAAENPQHFFLRLTNSDFYKLRIDDYRIIVGINWTKTEVQVKTIGHRKNVYD